MSPSHTSRCLSGIQIFLRAKTYEIVGVEKHPAATIIDARPIRSGLKPKPGAFAFISIRRKGLREPHPFTVSGTKADGSIQFSVRGLGDFTKRLRERVQVGDRMRIEGGYGRFNFRRGGDKQIWVAGGIGITPFLTWADSLEENENRQIELFYCVGKAEEAVGLKRFEAAANRTKSFKLHLHVSSESGRFGVDQILAITDFKPSEASLWFCGPPPMRAAIEAGLKKNNQSPQSVHFERFEFR